MHLIHSMVTLGKGKRKEAFFVSSNLEGQNLLCLIIMRQYNWTTEDQQQMYCGVITGPESFSHHFASKGQFF